MKLLTAIIIILLLGGCAAPKNIHINLREEINNSIREGFGDDATYFLDTTAVNKEPTERIPWAAY
jgi:hypothetical protein